MRAREQRRREIERKNTRAKKQMSTCASEREGNGAKNDDGVCLPFRRRTKENFYGLEIYLCAVRWKRSVAKAAMPVAFSLPSR